MAHQAELLAPAGSADAAWAALAYGADAVYAGLPRFSARAEAANFSEQELDELIGYAHAHGRKVYTTFNTLVQQHELPDALEALALIDDLNADGVIVQDMGVARMVRRFFPGLELHASTQLAVHNLAGAKLLADMGFSRVVLARELSLEEIGTITRGCGIETEVFIHGALCYSYSGLCLFSSHLNGRSGNRGKCAYCCRQTFTSQGRQDGGDPHRPLPAGSGTLPFSMKDFAVGGHFDDLLNTGVASLKIEGRMKGATYVGAVTDFYRRRMAHRLNEVQQQELLSDIQTIFGRPATDLYLKDPGTNPIDPTTNGHRGAPIGTVERVFAEHGGQWIGLHTTRSLMKHDGLKIELARGKAPFNFFAQEIRFSNDRKKHLQFEIPAGSTIDVKLPAGRPFIEIGQAVYCSASQEVRQRYGFQAPRPGTYRQRKPVDVRVELKPDGLRLSAQGAGVSVERTIEMPLAAARQPGKTEAAVRKSVEKTGDTEWELGKLEIEDAGCFAPASILNEGRRQLLDQLSSELEAKKQAEHFARLEALVQPPAGSGGHERWSVKLRDPTLLDGLGDEELERIDEVVVEGRSPGDRGRIAPALPVRMAAPVIGRDRDGCPQPSEAEQERPAPPVEVANVGALHDYRTYDDLTADWPLYTLNTEAAEQWRELGIGRMVLSPEDTGGNLKELVRLLGDRAIVVVYQHTPLMVSATPPDAGGELSDRKKRTMRIERNGDLYVLIFEEPFSLTEYLDELRKAGGRHFRVDLTYGVYDARQATGIIRNTMAGLPTNGSHDGNYGRAL